MEFTKKDGEMYAEMDCGSIYGPMKIRFNVDPKSGKRLRRILSVEVKCPTIDAVAEFSELMDKISRPAESLPQYLAKQQLFGLATTIMAELSRGE